MARTKIELDWNIVDDLLSKFCDGTEVAQALGISFDTLEKRIKETFKTDFTDYKRQKRAIGEKRLRELQWIEAEGGNVTMLIFLGKQYLGQSDKTQSRIEFPDTPSFEINFRNGND